jgi:quercetin dioxygenase-like cupin family protein
MDRLTLVQVVFKAEFENESVQVVRITIGPHAKLPMHDLTARVVVPLTDQDLRLTFPNRETREEHGKAGQTMWVSAQRHAGENLTDQPIEFIAVIPKSKYRTAGPRCLQPARSAAPTHPRQREEAVQGPE